MLKMVDGTGIIGVDMVCPLGGAVSPPQPPNYDNVEMEGMGSLTLQNSLKAPLERLELIGNSTQGENPAPDNPQEIESVGRKSKNLLNLQKQPDVKETYLGWKVSDGRNVVLSVKDKGNNADITGCYLGLSRTGGSSDGVVWVVNNGSVAVKEVVSKNQYVSVFPSNETTVRKLLERFDIQVEYGNNATDYEPYGYLLDVKVTGENLLSNKPTDWMIGKTTSWGAVPQTPVSYGKNVKNAIATINVKSSTNYSFINKETNKLWVCRIIELDANGLGLVNHALYANESFNYKKYSFSTRSNTANIVFEIKRVDNTELLSTDIESIKIMLVEGDIDESTPYEPYTEQTLTLTSDRPLTKWDKLVEQGGEYGWLYGSKIYVVTGNEVFESRDGYNIESYTNRFFILNDLLKKNDALKPLAYMKCLRNVQYVYSPNIFEEGFETNINQFHIKLSNDRVGILASDDHAVRTAKFSGYMKKIHKNGNPIEILYATTDTVFLPLSQEEQTQLRNLHSYNDTTHITVDSGEVLCGIKLTYRKEK